MIEQYYMDATGVIFRQSGLGGRKPVVVLDPEDREQVERLTRALDPDDADYAARTRWGEVQAALRSLVSPPKPDEPQGLGAVVEDANGEIYVRDRILHKRPWQRLGTTNHVEWCEIDATPIEIKSQGWSE